MSVTAHTPSLSANGTAPAPTIAFETITPDDARLLLNMNPRNRNVRPDRVAQYARDMAAGRWLSTGEAIQIAPDGLLLNGQHRLHAVIQADVTITVPVMRNVPPEFQTVADRGASRTFGDVLKLQFNESNANNLAATVKLVHLYRRTGQIIIGGGNNVASMSELIDAYKREPGIRGSLAYGELVQKARLATPRSLAAALHYLFAEADPNEAGPFFRSVASGDMLMKTDPIFALRRNLLRLEARRGRPDHVLVAALWIKTFNYRREGRQVQNLIWHPTGTRAEEFPRILTADEIG